MREGTWLVERSPSTGHIVRRVRIWRRFAKHAILLMVIATLVADGLTGFRYFVYLTSLYLAPCLLIFVLAYASDILDIVRDRPVQRRVSVERSELAAEERDRERERELSETRREMREVRRKSEKPNLSVVPGGVGETVSTSGATND